MTRKNPGERWYRRLLQLYPRDFRDEFGAEMTRLYRDRRRDERGWKLWGSLLVDLLRTAPSQHLAMLRQDLSYAWRALQRTPVVTATTILTLALGVGASTAVFSVVHAVLLRPLPYPESDRLVELFESNITGGVPSMRVSALNYLSWAERSTSFEMIAAFRSTGRTLTGQGDPELLSGSLVTASLFRVMRVTPVVGRPLQPEDEQRASPPVVVLSEPFWRSRFGGDRHIVGRSITLDGERHQVVGVMPATFRDVGRAQATGTAVAQIFVPMTIEPSLETRGNHTLRVVGRLRPGVALERARTEMGAVSAALEQEFPETNANWGVRIETLSDTTIEPHVRRSLLLVLGAVSMVFLIACANIANLMLARGSQRYPELAVRTALGAGRSRLVRQLLTESSCLAAMSGAGGVLIAAVTHPFLRTLLPPSLPRVDDLRFDGSVVAFGLLISSASGIIFGIVPALRATRLDLSLPVRLVGRATTDSTRAALRQVLSAAEIAVATMLLVGAGLLLQGFVRLQRVPLGFEPDGVLTARVSLPRSAYPDAESTGQFYRRLVTATLAAGPPHSIAVATSAPFAPGVRAAFRRPNRNQASAASAEDAAEHIVDGEYFRVLGIPLVAGRWFDERDTVGGPGAAIVSERLARTIWPENPIGQILERPGRSFEIVGVVGDVRGSDTEGLRGGGLEREPRAAVYFPAAQLPQATMTLLIRPAGEPAEVIGTVRQAMRKLDPTLPLQQVRPLSDWLMESLAPTRVTTRLATIFALSALLLASVGIYGVLAYAVGSRTKEIGVRMAIGATRGRVMRLVLREGMTSACIGIAVGLSAAFLAARVLAPLLFEVHAHDPVTFATVGGAVTLVAFLAAAIPAVHAVGIDPAIAMRTE